MKQYQPRSTRIDAWFLSIAAVVVAALALGCSRSDAPGNEGTGKKGGRKEIRTVCVRAAAFSPDGKLLVIAYGPGAPSAPAIRPQQRELQLWEVDSGKLLHTFQIEKPANAIFFGQGGKKLLACHVDKVTIFDVGGGTKDAHNQLGGIPLAILPDGKKMLLYKDVENEADKVLELWDPFTPKVLKKFSGTTYPRGGAAISPDGRWGLVPCIPHQAKPRPIDPTILQLWDLSNGKLSCSFPRETNLQRPLSFFPSSKYALAQRLDELRPDGNLNCSLVVLEIPSGKITRVLERTLRNRQEVGFSPDGKQVVICDEPVGKPFFDALHLRRLEVETGKELWNVELPINEREGVMVSALSADTGKFFRGTGAEFHVKNLRLEIWDAAAGRKLRDLKSEPPE
jgi:WD40 repeat protein